MTDDDNSRGSGDEQWARPGVPFEALDGGGAQISPALSAPLAAIREAVAELRDAGARGDLLALDREAFADFARDVESVRTQFTSIDPYLVEAAEAVNLPARQCTRTLASALADLLKISPGAAKARVALARQLLPTHNFSGQATSVPCPHLAEAITDGSITTHQITVIAPALRRIADLPGITPATLSDAETSLIEHAGAFGPASLRRIADKLDDVLHPDGTLPDDRITQARRELTIGPERRDGTHAITGYLTRTTVARLNAVLSPLSAPRPATDPLGPDPRTPAQRRHDALDEALTRLLDSPDLPRSGGTPATVHLLIDHDRLADQLGLITERGHSSTIAESASRNLTTRIIGTTSDGTHITLADALELTNQTALAPIIASATRGILDYGRDRRILTEGQTNALIARDKGCSFPECTAPPDWCERHHVLEWIFGGTTDITNATLLCGNHHREFEARGWQVVIHNGIPTWIPPRWIDPERRPLVNIRITSGTPITPDRDAVHAAAAELENLRFARGKRPKGLPTSDRTSVRAIDGDGGDRPTNDPTPIHGIRIADANNADPSTTAAEIADEPLDDVDDLTHLLAQHIDPERRHDFTQELGELLHQHGFPTTPTRATWKAQ